METSEDKQWVRTGSCSVLTTRNAAETKQASRYLLDPLNAPEPSHEDGPGTRFNPAPPTVRSAQTSTSKDGDKGSSANMSVKAVRSSIVLLQFTSNSKLQLPDHRQRLRDGGHHRSSSQGRPSTEVATSSTRTSLADGRPRGSSLGARFPGDESARPLDIIRRESRKANRAPHLRKKQHIGVDTIDRLDAVGPRAYHHGSAYDAASLAWNQNPKDGPVWAVAGSTREALRATPREKVLDSLRHRRPLDGVAAVPPGPDGRVFRYKEGTDLMIAEGNYKRWPGVVRLASAPQNDPPAS